MARRKSVEELDAELERLEAELAELERGSKKKAPAAPAAAPPSAAPTDESPPGSESRRRFGLGRKKKEGDQAGGPAPAGTPGAGTAEAPPPEAKRRFGFRRRSDDPERVDEVPAPVVTTAGSPPRAPGAEEPAKPDEAAASGPASTATPPDDGAERVTPPPAAPAPAGDAPGPRGLLARFRGEKEPEPDGFAVVEQEALREEEADERRRGFPWLPVIIILIVLLILVGAVLAYLQLGGGDAPEALFTIDGATDPASGAMYALATTPVRFDASTTTGADTFVWDFGDGSPALETATARADHTYAARGSFTVTLTARNAGGDATAAAPLSVLSPPIGVIAATRNGTALAPRGPGGNTAFAGDEISFDAAGSTSDPDHPLAEYQWDFESDGTVDARGVAARHAFGDAGVFRVRLTVVDDLGNANPAPTELSVRVGAITVTEGTVGTGLPMSPATVDVPVPVTLVPGARPVQVQFLLTWNAPAVFANSDLNVTVLDAAGTIVAVGTKAGDQNRIELTVDGVTGFALGAWTARVGRAAPAGVLSQSVGAQDVPFTLTARVVY